MSILGNEEELMDNIAKDSYKVLREKIRLFIRDYMEHNFTPGSKTRYFVDITWVELKWPKDSPVWYGPDIELSDQKIGATPVEKNQRCSLPDIYETVSGELVIVPKVLRYPMLLEGCQHIPNYIKIETISKDLDIFDTIIKNGPDVQEWIGNLREKSYRGNLSAYDYEILISIYEKFGHYDSEVPEIKQYEMKMKNMLIINKK